MIVVRKNKQHNDRCIFLQALHSRNRSLSAQINKDNKLHREKPLYELKKNSWKNKEHLIELKIGIINATLLSLHINQQISVIAFIYKIAVHFQKECSFQFSNLSLILLYINKFLRYWCSKSEVPFFLWRLILI